MSVFLSPRTRKGGLLVRSGRAGGFVPIFLLLLLLPTAALRVQAQGEAPQPGDRSVIRLTAPALDEEERRFLQEHPVIRIGVDPDYPPFDRLAPDGRYEGMGADYCRLVAERLGVRFEVVQGLDWQGALAGIRAGEVDMIPVITPTPERREYLLFTQSYLHYPLVIVTRKGASPVTGLHDFIGRRLGVVRGYATAEVLRERFPQIEPYEVPNVLAGLLAVSTGQVGGFLTDLAVALYLAEEHAITNVKPAAPAGIRQPGFSMGVRRDWPLLVSILDKALASISPEEHRRIRQRWLGDEEVIDKMEQEVLRLSAEEERWLQEHPTLRLGVDPAWPPFEFFDQAGVYSGIAADYVAALSDRLGVRMTPVPGLSWSEVLERAAKREIDLLPCITRTPARSRYLLFTRPYLDLPMIIVTRSDYPLVSGISDFADGRLAVVRNYVSHELLQRDYPQKRLLLLESIDAGLEAVVEGRADGFIGNIAAVSYATERLGMNGLKVAAATPYRFTLAMAVRDDWPELVAILDRALAAIPKEEKERFYQTWTRVRVERRVDWRAMRRIALAIGGVALLLIGASLYWTRRLAAEVRVRRRAEAELLKLTRAVEFSPASVVITDRQGTIEYVNPAFTEVTGYAPGEVLGQTPRILKSGRQDEAFYADLWQTILAGRVWRGDFCNRKKDGSEFWESAAIAPIIDDSGAITHFVAVKEDITERKRAEDELAKAKERAEAATRAKSEFLANMSHEIRTPMNAILGMCHLCLQTMLSDRQRDYLEKIEFSARSLLRILDDILDFSKIEAGKLSMEQTEFLLADVLSNLLTMTASQAEDKGLEFLVRQDPEVPEGLVGDPLRLTQVLLNLVNNAIKFTDQGEVELAISAEEVGSSQAVLRFTVRDTGIGLSPAEQERIFGAFTQADSSISRRYGGTGLGLVICRRLVQMMGGELSLRSAPGQGATFSFTAVFGRHDRTKRRSTVPAGLAGMRVLVVDDNESARLTLADMLRRMGFEVHLAASGGECLAEVMRAVEGEAPYDLLLLDYRLGDGDGIAVARQLREKVVEGRRPQIVMITAYGGDDVRAAAAAVGIHAFLAKPVTPSSLLDAIVTSLCRTEPDAEVCASLGPRSQAVLAPGLRGRRVLVAEDNEINRQVASELLASWGMEVECAADGREAVRLACKQRFDLALMDIQMPGMDGLAATRRIREQGGRLARMPIVAMTAHATEEARRQCLAAGMDAHVVKPLDPDGLQAVLLALLGNSSSPSKKPSLAFSTTVGQSRASANLTNSLALSEPVEFGGTSLCRTQPVFQRAAREKEAEEKAVLLDSGAALRRLAGNRRLYHRLLAEFAREQRDAPHRIRAALAAERERARRLAHTLKGVSGNIGAMAVHLQAKKVEAAIVEENDSALDQALRVLQEMLAATTAEIARYSGAEAVADRPAETGQGGEEAGGLLQELARLQRLVELHDLEAEETFLRLEPQMQRHCASECQRLRQALAQLDFAAAEAILREIVLRQTAEEANHHHQEEEDMSHEPADSHR